VRVLHLIATARAGGSERFLAELVRHLDSSRIVSGVAVMEGPGPLSAAYGTASYVAHLSRDRLSWWRLLPGWYRAVRTFRPDVVVLYGARSNLIGRFLPILRRAAVIAAVRSVTVDERNSALAVWLDRATFGRVSVAISNSEAAVRKYERAGFPRDRLMVISGGLDRSAFEAHNRTEVRRRYGLEDSDFVILTVANLKPVKNHLALLEAFSRQRWTGGRLLLWLVGEGPERPAIVERARALAITERVILAGAETEVAPRYIAADMFVLPSHFEGQPRSVMEAMAAGLPVIASAVGDVPWLLRGDAGLLVEPPVTADGFAKAIDRLLADPSARHDYARRAGAAARARLDLQASVRAYEEVFETVARTRARVTSYAA
jgi:glycosyltransferase involved in cell wall biosynthesis